MLQFAAFVYRAFFVSRARLIRRLAEENPGDDTGDLTDFFGGRKPKIPTRIDRATQALRRGVIVDFDLECLR